MGGGGASSQQKQAADQQMKLNQQEAAIASERTGRERDAYNQALPFIQNRLTGGNPYTNVLLDNQSGVIARSFQPAYARIARQDSGGTADAQVRALDAEKARAQADSMAGVLANDEGSSVNALAALTNQQQIAAPQSFFGLANQGNQGIYSSQALMNQGSPIAGILGGVASAALSNPKNKIPF